MKTCADANVDAVCCGSCHVDADEYDMAMCEPTGPDGAEWYVCCAVATALGERWARDAADAGKGEG